MTASPGIERQIQKQRKQPKLPCLMEMEMEVDRISNLPGNIVDKILSLLPLRDAVRSSILSSNWRYNWANLTSLVFDFQSLQRSSEHPTISVDKEVKIVDHVLLLHNGPIRKFKLVNYVVCDIESDIDRWILFLSRRSIKEFILKVCFDGDYYKLPSWLYLCDKLSHLKLVVYCFLKPPSSFNGFKILTSLHLQHITIDQDVLENLIYMCPLLESLTLMDVDRSAHLKIHAPKLTFFDFEGVFENVNFESTVNLSTVSISVNEYIDDDHKSSLGTTSKLIKFFASLPNIQRLKAESLLLKILAVDHMVPRRLPTPCMELNYLSLWIYFNDMDECLAALCILRSSPNLLELELTSDERSAPRAVTKNLLEEDYQNCFFNRLRFVKCSDLFGDPRELKFINLLLANSPILERMTVKPASKGSGVELLKELLQFRRASSRAEIIYLAP